MFNIVQAVFEPELNQADGKFWREMLTFVLWVFFLATGEGKCWRERVRKKGKAWLLRICRFSGEFCVFFQGSSPWLPCPGSSPLLHFLAASYRSLFYIWTLWLILASVLCKGGKGWDTEGDMFSDCDYVPQTLQWDVFSDHDYVPSILKWVCVILKYILS